MHDTAMWWGKEFLNNYSISGRILEVGSYNRNGGLRDVCPEGSEWIGADLEAGPGVDVVLEDPHKLPFEDASFDVVLSSSVFEHTDFFWELFKEKCRCVKPGGYIYINAPSTGEYHPYPHDSWRFYRDAGYSLEKWSVHCGYPVKAHHLSVDSGTQYCDFVAIFQRQHDQEIFKNHQLASNLTFNYNNAKPFPNITIDNFINPEISAQCFKELKETNYWATESSDNSYMSENQVNKWFTPWDENSAEQLKHEVPTVSRVLNYFQSPEFIDFLKELTGIDNLLPDPHMWGGGCHKIENDGKLNLHVDYNINPVTSKFRVLNMLLYLNPNWEDEWGGHLQLWDKHQKRLEHKIAPLMNRAVIFTLSDDSVHGHPEPLNAPEGFERYSIAMYYFLDEPNQEYYERTSVHWHNELQSRKC
mgnify:FL=1